MATATLNISEEVKKQFPEILEMIVKSESMNDEERQYWIDVLPIMSEDQIDNLRSILDNEKKEISEAENEYKSAVEEEAKKAAIDFDEMKYKEKKRLLKEAEAKHEEEEKAHEEDILKEIEGMDL